MVLLPCTGIAAGRQRIQAPAFNRPAEIRMVFGVDREPVRIAPWIFILFQAFRIGAAAAFRFAYAVKPYDFSMEVRADGPLRAPTPRRPPIHAPRPSKARFAATAITGMSRFLMTNPCVIINALEEKGGRSLLHDGS